MDLVINPAQHHSVGILSQPLQGLNKSGDVPSQHRVEIKMTLERQHTDWVGAALSLD